MARWRGRRLVPGCMVWWKAGSQHWAMRLGDGRDEAGARPNGSAARQDAGVGSGGVARQQKADIRPCGLAARDDVGLGPHSSVAR